MILQYYLHSAMPWHMSLSYYNIKPYQTTSSLTNSYYITQYDSKMLPAFCHIVAPFFSNIIKLVFCYIMESTFFIMEVLPYHTMPKILWHITPCQTKSSHTKSYYTTQYDIIILLALCHLVAPAFCHIITLAFCHII